LTLETKRGVEIRSIDLSAKEREKINAVELSRYNSGGHVTSDLNYRRNIPTMSFWGETKENPAYHYKPAIWYIVLH
jgi:hypothetical protein